MARRCAWVLAVFLTLGIFGAGTVAAATMSGEEILQKVDRQAAATTSGSLISAVHLDVTYDDGTTQSQSFGILTKEVAGAPDRSLTCFLTPTDVAGMIFLWIKPQTAPAQMWLYLPALGEAREFVGQAQGQSFAGGTISYNDLGSPEFATNYESASVGEEALIVDGVSHPCYVVSASAKPNADAEYPKVKLWVDRSSFLVLRSEGAGEDGEPVRTIIVTRIGRFEDRPIAREMIAENVTTGAETTVVFADRVRPAQPIPDAVFDPKELSSFDPLTYGWSL